MNDSIWDDPRITAYVLGELPSDQQAAFEAELRVNEGLASAVEEARGIADRLAVLFEQESTPALESGRRQSILAAAPSLVADRNGREKPPEAPGSPTPNVQPSRFSWRVAAVALAIAASLLVIVGVVPPFQKDQPVAWQFDVATDKQEAGQFQIEWRGESELSTPSSSTASPDAVVRKSTPSAGEAEVAEEAGVPEVADVAGEPGEPGEPEVAEVAGEPGEAEVAGGAETAAQRFLHRDALQSHVEGLRNRQVAAEEAFSRPLVESDAYRGAIDSSSVLEPFSPESGRMVLAPATELAGLDESNRLDVLNRAPTSWDHGDARPSVTLQARLPERMLLGVEPSLPSDRGRGPGMAGDRFDPITDNAFRRVSEHPLSTFSVDVDTASYSKVRDFLLRSDQLPRPDAVRIEELVNYFDYGYQAPDASSEHPFDATVEMTSCPWNESHRLARIAIQGQRLDPAERPRANLVFLIDSSGSMNAPNRLPLVQHGMKLLLEQLDERDRVAIVVYAGSAGMVLDSTPVSDAARIRRALTELAAGGSTNGGAGITLAYQTARDHFIPGGVNRVILCTDGDFNVGTTGTDELVRTVEREAKGGVFLSVLGFGMGNHNDAMLEQISGRGDGNYFFIDDEREARKVLVEQVVGTLVTIAKDVKLQIEFNPRQVGAYRLIGYENRVLAKEDFNDDQKDAGEIGAGHSVTAFYELVPAGRLPDAVAPAVDDLRYQTRPEPTKPSVEGEWMTLKLRYKRPAEEISRLIEIPVHDRHIPFQQAESSFRFAAAVAGFGMQLRRSPYAGTWTLPEVRSVAAQATANDPQGRRAEFLQLIDRALRLTTQEQSRN